MYPTFYPIEQSTSPATVCVTGATGFVAGHVVRRLLAAGHTVRGTVRDPNNEALLAPLKALPGASERLSFHKADLTQPGTFDAAIESCSIVIHTASPFFTPKRRADVQPKLLTPAVKGVEHVLEAVNRIDSVQRVVVTSSVAAIAGDSDQKGEGVPFSEADWAEKLSETFLPYNLSKKLAEEKAWEMAKAQNRWKLVTVNPSFVMGPPIGDRADGTSLSTVKQIMEGKLAMAPVIGFGVVDVRDVAAAHCLAAFHADADGRYICSEGTYTMHDMGAWLKERYPGVKAPEGRGPPRWLLWLIGPVIGMSRDFVSAYVGKKPVFDHTKIERELGFKFSPAKTAMQDMAARLVELGQVQAPEA